MKKRVKGFGKRCLKDFFLRRSAVFKRKRFLGLGIETCYGKRGQSFLGEEKMKSF
jgi:hypothetical protein